MAAPATTPAENDPLQTRAPVPWERHARAGAGLVLFVFVVTHFLNHALGIFGVGVMEAAQEWRLAVWKSRPGAILLYGAAAVHAALALRRLVQRQTWRMPIDEAIQIVTGLTIPLLIVGHITGTRIGGSFFGVKEDYVTVLYLIWPYLADKQTLLLLVVWLHGCLGIHHLARHMAWYRTIRPVALACAVLVPALALAGFVSAGREVALRTDLPPPFDDRQFQGLVRAEAMIHAGLGAVGLLVAGILAFGVIRRRAGGQIVIDYRGRGPVRVPRGTSVLEASRIHGIPHPSVCGGRGRCSTCRVHVLRGAEKLDPPNTIEAALLARIGAQSGVRLGCQLRPRSSIGVRILMPALGARGNVAIETNDAEWGADTRATVLAFDLRAFNVLTRDHLAYEVAVLVNRFLAEMQQAVRHHGGRIDVFYGDGLVAVFDDANDRSRGAVPALRAAADMYRVLEIMNREFARALPLPIRAGCGVHNGSTILAKLTEGLLTSDRIALGHTVAIADRLQSATKEVLADILVSEEAALAAGLDFARFPRREVTVESIGTTITAYAVRDAAALAELLRGNAPREDAATATDSKETIS